MSSADSLIAQSLRDHSDCGLTAQDLAAMYYYMHLTRSVEDRVRTLYLQGKIPGAVYSSRGQEGSAVASAYALQPQDYVAPLIRDLGASFVRGIEPRRVFAQWLGRLGGPTAGRDGNLHFGDLSRGVLPPISMLGTGIPVCAGIALASKQQGLNSVALTYIGDGGANTGDFHEGLNFAAVLKLPLVVIVEDNGFAYSTPRDQHVAIQSFTERAGAYGIRSVAADGNDVVDVYAATRGAVDRARAGGGPTLIEVKTFRMRGHAEHDDARYVPKDLLGQWAQRDPIDRLVRYMTDRGIMGTTARDEIDARVASEVLEAARWAEESPLPDPATQRSGVYAP